MMDLLSNELIELIFEMIGLTTLDYIEKCRLRSVCFAFCNVQFPLPRMFNSSFSIPLCTLARLKHYHHSESLYVFDICANASCRIGCHPCYLIDLGMKSFPSARYFWPEERLIWTSRLGSRLSTRHRRSVKGVCLLEKGLEFDEFDESQTSLCEKEIRHHDKNLALQGPDRPLLHDEKLASESEIYNYSRGTRENKLFDIQCVMDSVSRSLGSTKKMTLSGLSYEGALSCVELSRNVTLRIPSFKTGSLQQLELTDGFFYDIHHLFRAVASSSLLVLTLTNSTLLKNAYVGAVEMLTNWSSKKDDIIRSFVIRGKSIFPLSQDSFWGLVGAMRGVGDAPLTEVSCSSFCTDSVYLYCSGFLDDKWNEAISYEQSFLMHHFSQTHQDPFYGVDCFEKQKGKKRNEKKEGKNERLRTKDAQDKPCKRSKRAERAKGAIEEIEETEETEEAEEDLETFEDAPPSDGKEGSSGVAELCWRAYKNPKRERDRYMWQPKDYRCKHCGFLWPKHSVIVSFRQTAVSNCMTRKKNCSAWKEASQVLDGDLFVTDMHVVGGKGVHLTPPQEFVLQCDAKGFQVGVNSVDKRYEILDKNGNCVFVCRLDAPVLPS